MKLYELFEQRETFTISADEMDALPSASPHNMESAFKVKNIPFDNAHGMGNTPNNREVMYFGFAIELNPSNFLKIVQQANRDEDATKFAKLLTAENPTPIASPTLYLEINLDEWKEGEPLRLKVTGHEGRGRMTAIQKISHGLKVPVHVIPRGLRARHFDEKFFADLRNAGIVPEDRHDNYPRDVDIGKIFWNGQML